jgi:hypothetical protein
LLHYTTLAGLWLIFLGDFGKNFINPGDNPADIGPVRDPVSVYEASRQEPIIDAGLMLVVWRGWVYCQRRQEPLATRLQGVNAMSKGMNSKKQTRKAPAKTMLEKRAAKKAKKATKGALR